jgi:hypothetical protein
VFEGLKFVELDLRVFWERVRHSPSLIFPLGESPETDQSPS